MGQFQRVAPRFGLAFAEQKAVSLGRFVHEGGAGVEGTVDSPSDHEGGVSLDGGSLTGTAAVVLGAGSQADGCEQEACKQLFHGFRI